MTSPMEWGQDFDFGDSGVGIANALINLDTGQLNNTSTSATSSACADSQTNGNVSSSYVPAPCAHSTGGECESSTFWRQRCEQMSIQMNHRYMMENNMKAEIERLHLRLKQAEKNIKIYQQKLVDVLSDIDPVKKELDEVKSQLIVEIRERSKYQCEAESNKAVSIQLQAFLGKHEEEVANLRQQVGQLQTKLGEKTADTKKFQEKSASLESKYEKLKQQHKVMNSQVGNLRKMLDQANAGRSLPIQRRRRRHFDDTNATENLDNGSEDSSMSSDDDAWAPVDDIQDELLKKMASPPSTSSLLGRQQQQISTVPDKPQHHISSVSDRQQRQVSTSAVVVRNEVDRESAPVSSNPAPTTGKYQHSFAPPPVVPEIINEPSPSTSSSNTRTIPRTKAMMVLERKARQEEQGVYSGGPTKLFCRATGRQPPRAPVRKAPDEQVRSEKTASASEIAPIQIPDEANDDQTVDIDEIITRLSGGLREFMVPPLSPIPELRQKSPVAVEHNENGAERTLSEEKISRPSAEGESGQKSSEEKSHREACPEISRPSVDDESGQEIVVHVEESTSCDLPQTSLNIVAVQHYGIGAERTLSEEKISRPSAEDESGQEISRPLVEGESGQKSSEEKSHREACPEISRPSVDDESGQEIVVPIEESTSCDLPQTSLNIVEESEELDIPIVSLVITKSGLVDFTGNNVGKSTHVSSNHKRTKTSGHPPLCKLGTRPKENRSYGAILDSMLSGAGTSHVSAFEKWMKKPMGSPESVACTFIEAIKRHNAVPWISTQFKTATQAAPSGLRLLKTGGGAGSQSLTANDKKLSDLLTCLLSTDANVTEWKKLVEIMLMGIKSQLAILVSQMSPVQSEALCRWCFYLCQRKPSKMNLQVTKEILLIISRLTSTQQHQQCVLNIFLTLAMVWPNAFKRIIAEPRADTEQILQSVFKWLMWYSPTKSKAKILLDQCLGEKCDLNSLITDQQPSFDLLIREQIGILSCLSSEFELIETGIGIPDDFWSIVNKLLVIAPYCDDRSMAICVESSMISIGNWHGIDAEDALAMGGMKKLITDLLLLARLASYCIPLMEQRMDSMMDSIRSMIFGTNHDQVSTFTITGNDQILLTYAAVEMVTNSPVTNWKTQNLLKDISNVLNEEKSSKMDSGRRHYQKRCAEYCNRLEVKR